MALGVFGPNPVSDTVHAVVAWLPRGIVAVVIVVVAMAIANVARDLVGTWDAVMRRPGSLRERRPRLMGGSLVRRLSGR